MTTIPDGISGPEDRLMGKLANLAARARSARDSASPRAAQRAHQRMIRAYERAARAGVVVTDPRLRARFLVHMEGAFAALTLPDYTPETDWPAGLTAEDSWNTNPPPDHPPKPSTDGEKQ